jgi:hypothetical protein
VVEGAYAVDVEGRALRGDPPGLPGRWTVEQGSGPEVPGGPTDRGPGAVVCVARAAEEASPRKSRLDRHKEAIDRILRADLDAPRKQRHTTKRIFDRLVAEYDAEGISYPMVRAYVVVRKPEIWVEAGRGPPQVFIPQTHRPGQDAEVDFGDVWIDLAGVRTLCSMFVFRLSFSGKAVHRVSASEGQGRSSKATCTLSACWAACLPGRSATTT